MQRRELKPDHLYLLLNIMSKIGVKDMIIKLFQMRINNKNKELNADSVEIEGTKLLAEILDLVLLNADKAKNEINKLLADLHEVDINIIESLSIVEYADRLIDLFTSEDFQSFLKCILSSFSKASIL